MNLDRYNISQTTHVLQCRHAIGRSGYSYTMPCILLGKTISGKVKIVVFGDRNWKGTRHKKRIRYVDSTKLLKKPLQQ